MAIKQKTENKAAKTFVKIGETNRKAAEKIFKSASFFDANANALVDFTKVLITSAMVKDLYRCIDLLWKKFKYVPSRLAQVNQEFIDTGINIYYTAQKDPEFQKLMAAKTQACIMRWSKNYYKEFINPLTEPEGFDSMDLHEKGHIKYNHTISVNVAFERFKAELNKIWDAKLAKYFEAEIKKNPKNKDKIARMLFAEFSNIAQDMEINSKEFKGEWKDAKEIMARSGLVMFWAELNDEFDSLSGLIKDPKKKDIDSSGYGKDIANPFLMLLKNVEKRIDKNYNGEDFQYCYPTNKGWPEELDWMVYMMLLIKDIDETMQEVISRIKAKFAAAGQGNGSGQGSGNGNTQGTGGGGKTISQDVLDQYIDDLDSQNDASSGSGNDDGEEDMGDDEDEGEGEGGSTTGGTRSDGGDGRSKSGHTKSQVEFEMCDTYDDFSKLLHKICLGKKNTRLNTDVLYYSNRKKMSSDVVTPRRHYIEKWMPTNCTIVIDVSGSVPTNYVENMINTIVDSNSGIDLARSHIIFCDTRVVSDEIMSKRTKKVFAGGGTSIDVGITYAMKYVKKSTDKLIVISDLCDDLGNWLKAAKGKPGIKYIIGYGDKSSATKLLNDANRFAKEWNNTFKTFFVNTGKEVN